MYGVNSRYVREKKVPRDELVHFVSKEQEKILLQHANNRLEVEDIRTYYCPERDSAKILRKDYPFLVEMLKQKKVIFQWGKLES